MDTCIYCGVEIKKGNIRCTMCDKEWREGYRAGSEIVQSGIELGRAENEKRIKELEDRNAELVKMLTKSRYLSSNGSGGQSGKPDTTVKEG